MADRACPTCGQPLPAEQRRDPPLPPLPAPNVVTIHDLPEGERATARVAVERFDAGFGKSEMRRLVADG